VYRMPLKQTLFAFVAVVILACGTPTGGCGCSPVPPQTHVAGIVSSAAGPISGAQITVSVTASDCASPAQTIVYVPATGIPTDATGRYDFGW
jgi:hypothetical protein